jgi:uncharacterized damage-inducible protein DinB
MKWFERKFEFTTPVELFPNVLERLRGAPARLDEKLLAIPAEVRTKPNGDGWSIQEHAGHLISLDALHYGRLLDFEAGVKELRLADLQNRATFEAKYNERSAADICKEFRRERAKFVTKAEKFPKEYWSRTGTHPRLQQPMRLIDMCIFVAEHDDHHLLRITELARALK